MKKRLTPYLLVAPTALLLLLFLVGIGNALVQSFGFIPAFGLTRPTLRYYLEILRTPSLLASVKLSVYISLVSSAVATVLGVIICAALVHTRRAHGRSLRIIRLPVLVPHTVVAVFIIALFSQSGLLARLLYQLGLLSSQDAFPHLLYSAGSGGVLLAYIWKEAPFVAYFVLALMESVSGTLGEAAATLGASPLRAFFTVTLPLSAPAIANAFLIIFAFSFGAYEMPFLLGATLPKALPVQAYVEYTHPDLRHRPYAMAMNGVILMLTLLLALAYFLLLQRKAKGLRGDGHE